MTPWPLSNRQKGLEVIQTSNKDHQRMMVDQSLWSFVTAVAPTTLTQTAVAPIAVSLQIFTFIYMKLPEFNHIHQILPDFT